jgi:hypothetical protein
MTSLFLRRLFKRVVRWCLGSAYFVLTRMLVDMAPFHLETQYWSGRRTSGQLDLWHRVQLRRRSNRQVSGKHRKSSTSCGDQPMSVSGTAPSRCMDVRQVSSPNFTLWPSLSPVQNYGGSRTAAEWFHTEVYVCWKNAGGAEGWHCSHHEWGDAFSLDWKRQ